MSSTASHCSIPTTRQPAWLFSPSVDLWTFGGSAVLSLVLLLIGWQAGWFNQTTPEWTWVTGVLLVDVAHVYATGFRVYFLPGEMARRPWLYGLTPVLACLVGWAVASESEPVFWRVLAYLAVFHFVRQQAGWVAWYRARGGARDWASAVVDYSAIYLATIYPLIYWHTHLPRDFWWFLSGDFVTLPVLVEQVTWPLYLAALTTYAARATWRYVSGESRWIGQDVVVGTTAVCWYAGIVALNSDYAFTVTNVFLHGIPYLVLTYWYARRSSSAGWMPARPWQAILLFLATVWLLAYAEELLWDRAIWQERDWLMGSGFEAGAARSFFIALLATPQITHYVLDGFLWRRSGNPELAEVFRRPAATSA